LQHHVPMLELVTVSAPSAAPFRIELGALIISMFSFFFFKQKTAYEIGLGIPAEPLFRSDSSEISESVNFCVMEAIKLCRLDTPIIFIEARINLSRFVVTGCAAKTSATVTFPSLNLISLFAFCFNIWLNGVA